ncbi:serine hydrolase domain-containing protein [Ilumatobacter sp.]|uniref:serine hydrolase domain-containing protein n=2 Tax=Ilumatobacter sp. TaxID=1967498 RepID=UPI0037505D86
MSQLEQLVDELFDRPDAEGHSLALVIQQGGSIVAERYGTQPANDFQPAVELDAGSTLISWSMAKSITHAAVGILVADASIDVDAPAPVVEWKGTPKEAITTLQLLEMRSGLHFIEDYVDGTTSNCIEMLFGDGGPSHAAYAAGQPLDHEPGTVWNYSSGTTNIVSRIIGDIVSGGPGGDPGDRAAAMGSFLSERLFKPVGMATVEAKFDGAGDFVGSSYVYASARDFARFGELYRHDGVTDLGNGAQILPSGWTAHAALQVAMDDESGFGYGRHWWSWPDIPGSYSCHGYEGQFIVVAPESEVVLVHLGKTDISVAPELRARLGALLQQLS